MTPHISGSFSLWQIALVAFWLVGIKATVMDVEPLQQLVNDTIRKCLVLADITDKQAAALCGISETHFRRALSGEPQRYISLVHLFRLPYRFWLHFGPMLMWMVAKQHAEEIAASFSARRA